MNDWRKSRAEQRAAEQKRLREKLKKFKEENPEEYAKRVEEIQKGIDKENNIVSDFRSSVGDEYFKAVSVHICPSLMCECKIPETPALHSPNIRTGQRCNDCGQTYSAVFYSIKRETKNQHTCGGFGIFVMSASEYRNSQQVKNLLSQWSGKVMLSGDGIPNNAKVHGYTTLDTFVPSKALFVICSHCHLQSNSGAASFSIDRNIRGEGWGDSSLFCWDCIQGKSIRQSNFAEGVTGLHEMPYIWDIVDWEMLFSSNNEFDWNSWQQGQKKEIEEQYYRFSNLRDQIDWGDLPGRNTRF